MYSVLIRPLKEEDALISYRWRNDPDIWKFTGHRPDIKISKEIELDWIRRVLNEKDSCRFAILADDVYIGNIQITDIICEEEGEYHIFIGEKDYWGKGIATLATWQLLRYARKKINLKRLYLFVNPQNINAIKVYEKCGFKRVSEEVRMVYDLSQNLIPAVSVFMMTYNQEAYIRQALESILTQKTNFDFDIVVGEDCSTDKTRNIVLEYADSYPGKFVLLLHKHNLGAAENQIAVFSACTGKYIAMCEGDDYWTNPLKLQTQVDILESNDFLSACFHDCGILYSNSGKKQSNTSRAKKYSKHTFTTRDLIIDWFINTCTVTFRRKCLYIPDVLSEFLIDRLILLLVSLSGPIVYIDKEMAVYRKHDGGVSRKKYNYQDINKIELRWDLFNQYTHGKFSKEIEFAKRSLNFDYDLGHKQQNMFARTKLALNNIDLVIFRNQRNYLRIIYYICILIYRDLRYILLNCIYKAKLGISQRLFTF